MLKVGMKWMALARVDTLNFFIPQTFEQHMKVAWSPTMEVQFIHLEGNLLIFSLFNAFAWMIGCGSFDSM
jgi:hypothetical protein